MKNIDMALIYGLWNEYAAAINTGDMERWISLWVDDGVQMMPDSPARIGKEQIHGALQAEISRFEKYSTVIQIEEVSILGDYACSHGRYDIEMTPKDRGMPRSYWGNFVGILVKEADGSWKITIECSN